ncbi:uncharacterized protein LOC128559431 isoform X2 [Mercenaria mercenaria]|uniref:uncharacterized protein LOC128559431 isoform X2 n=1 Tax=Mercenaria mercenaria TaxID=6596 RepID=UPI00234F157D|nr:uncharacterized protein LOC128559431 isoform X2 [Mercenaria mercenaria]
MHEQLHDDKEISSVVKRKVRVKDAIAVTKRDHIINGKNIDVTLCAVPQKRPLYEDKVLINGLTEEISDECLIYFLDAQAGIKTKSLAYHKERDNAVLLTAYTQIDFAKLKDGNQKFILERATLEFLQVEVSNCIYVENLQTDVSEDVVEIYFDNTKRSNGGPVRNVEMSTDHQSCLVYFEDYSVVDNVLEKKHLLSGQTLEVRKYFECVDLPEERSITLPPPMVIRKVNIDKLKFIQKTDAYKTKLENKLDICHAKIDWSELDRGGNVLKINCTAAPENVISNRLQRKWRKRTKQTVEKVMHKVGIYQKQLKSEEAEACLETLRSIICSTEDIKCDYDEEKKIVTVIGNSSIVNLASKFIDVTIIAHEPETKFTKLRVIFSSQAEISMIQKLEEFTELKMDFPNVKIKISSNDCAVELEGSANEVNGAKMILCDLKNTLITAFSDILPRLSVQQYTLPQTVDFISERLKRKNLIACWCVSEERLIICCPFKDVLDKTVNTIKSAVVQNDILISPESDSLIVRDIWPGKVEEWNKLYQGRVIVSFNDSESGSPKIDICATADLAPKLFDEIAGILPTKSEKKKEPDYSLGSEEDSEAKTTTVLVSNLPSDATEELVKHLFEDRSHDTENVVEVKVNSNNNKAKVKFKDNHCTEYVLRREHTLCGKKMKVERYHVFTDMTVGISGLQSPVVINDIDILKIKFLKGSKQCSSEIGRQLSDCHVKMSLPEENNTIVLECTFAEADEGGIQLITDWEERVRRLFVEYLGSLSCMTIEVGEDIWDSVLERIKLYLDPEKVYVSAF